MRSLIFAFGLLFLAESASALTCEQLFLSSSSNGTYFNYQAALSDPNLFIKVFNREVQVSADVLLLNLEHFENYKMREVKIVHLTKIDIPKTPEQVSVETISDRRLQPFPNWLFGPDGKTVSYFIHPTNTSSNIPFFTDVERHLVGPVAVTSSSRSMFVRTDDGYLYSIKMGTDYPEGLERSRNLKKLNNIQGEINLGIAHTKVVLDLEKRFSVGRKFSLVYELAAVTPETDIVGRYGMMIRDLKFLRAKNRYYLPAFSIPTIGEYIAKRFGKSYEKFWEIHFAQMIGEAKAELFLKYGMMMDWPHGQNLLIETDTNFMPTGKIVFRDLDEMKFYTPAAVHLLSEEQYNSVAHSAEIKFRWERTRQVIIPVILENLATPEVEELARRWQTQHDRAIRRAFFKALNIADFNDEAIELRRLFVIYKKEIEAHFKAKAEGP